jgi:hypothetical protein
MRASLFSWTAAVLSLGLGACVLSSPPSRNGRYTADITSMEKADFIHDSWVYRNPNKKVIDYATFLIEPVRVYRDTSKKVKKKARPFFNDLEEDYTDQLRSLIRTTYRITDTPAPGVLRVAVEVMDIKPIVQVKKNGIDTIVADKSMTGTKFEANCYDAQSGELIYGLSTLYKGDEYLAYEHPDLTQNIEVAFAEWTGFLKDRLDQAMKAKAAGSPAPTAAPAAK